MSNATERAAVEVLDALGTIAICYAPLVDGRQEAVGTRLTMLSMHPRERHPIGAVLDSLLADWPAGASPVLLAPLDSAFDDTTLAWSAPANAVLEIPLPALSEPRTRALVQELKRTGRRLALRGRPDASLPTELLNCFELTLLHVSEDRRRGGRSLPLDEARSLPYLVTGVQRAADARQALERGAAAVVGWPFDEAAASSAHGLRPGPEAAGELLWQMREGADLRRVDATVRSDPVLAYRLLALARSPALDPPTTAAGFLAAMTRLGSRRLERWLALLQASAAGAGATPPALRLAALRRGLFVQAIGSAALPAAASDLLYCTGAFSLLDRLTGAPLDALFERLAGMGPAAEAVVHRGGPFAPFLSLIEAVERGDPIGIRRQAELLRIPVRACNRALLGALAASTPAARGPGVA